MKIKYDGDIDDIVTLIRHSSSIDEIDGYITEFVSEDMKIKRDFLLENFSYIHILTSPRDEDEKDVKSEYWGLLEEILWLNGG
ncbi:hypothetical protein FACS1894105_04310 [Clostridia bacterium]|nr:hypothetical protein FACS1894105_04310 [Clostridia bacterium]